MYCDLSLLYTTLTNRLRSSYKDNQRTRLTSQSNSGGPWKGVGPSVSGRDADVFGFVLSSRSLPWQSEDDRDSHYTTPRVVEERRPLFK